jgi:sporulation protein YlmC with PRC-barrel domain
MTMQAQQLIGAQVTGGDGQVVGTVEQVFNDDADGRPVWARVRAGKRERFVPLSGSRVTGDGLNVPFDAQQIMSGPEVRADRHMSAEQADQLNQYFGLAAARPAGQPDGVSGSGGNPNDPASGKGKGPNAPAHGSGGGPNTEAREERGERGGRAERPSVGVPAQAGRPDAETRQDWIVRAEERVDVGT